MLSTRIDGGVWPRGTATVFIILQPTCIRGSKKKLQITKEVSLWNWKSVTLGLDLQHTQTVDARHRVAVADQVAPVPAVLAQPSLSLFFAYGSMVDRQVFHCSSPELTILLTFRVLFRDLSSLSWDADDGSWGFTGQLSSFSHLVWQHLSTPSNLMPADACGHISRLQKCLFCIRFRKWSFFSNRK